MIEGRRVEYEPILSSEPDSPQGHDQFPYARFVPAKDGNYVEPNYMGYSDYGGSLVERSNIEEFVEQFADHQGTEWWELYGSHGTRAIIVLRDADERVPELGEFFESLENYPLASEDRHSEMEHEKQNEDWDSYGRSDFRHFLSELAPTDSWAEIFDAAPNDLLDTLWWEVQREGPGDETREDGQSTYFDFQHVFGYRAVDALEEFTRVAVDRLPRVAREVMVKAFPAAAPILATFPDATVVRLTTGSDGMGRDDLFQVMAPEPVTANDEQMAVLFDALQERGGEWDEYAEKILRAKKLGRYAGLRHSA